LGAKSEQAKKSRQEDEASAKDDHHGPSAEPCNQFSTCLKPVHAEVLTEDFVPGMEWPSDHYAVLTTFDVHYRRKAALG